MQPPKFQITDRHCEIYLHTVVSAYLKSHEYMGKGFVAAQPKAGIYCPLLY